MGSAGSNDAIGLYHRSYLYLNPQNRNLKKKGNMEMQQDCWVSAYQKWKLPWNSHEQNTQLKTWTKFLNMFIDNVIYQIIYRNDDTSLFLQFLLQSLFTTSLHRVCSNFFLRRRRRRRKNLTIDNLRLSRRHQETSNKKEGAQEFDTALNQIPHQTFENSNRCVHLKNQENIFFPCNIQQQPREIPC